MRLVKTFIATVVLAAGFATASFAMDTLPAPESSPILTISGLVAVTNSEGAAVFDHALFSHLEATTFKTSTIWTSGVNEFTGVSLHDLIKELGLTGGTLRMYAINDYMIEIPFSDAVEGGPIIAYAMNGKPMSVRDKGPLWVVYPYDSKKDYQTDVIFSRSVWQLDRIEVIE